MRCFFIFTIVLANLSLQAGTYSGGDGTDTNPYKISTVDDWLELIDTSTDWDSYFNLTNDLDFEGANLTPVGIGFLDDNEDPYGTYFAGVFEGQGHVIRNFVIDQPDSHFVGLFGYVGSDTAIHNLGVENASISGNYFVGGLVGGRDPETLAASSITDCYATGIIHGQLCVGGLIGYNNASVLNCYSGSTVNGTQYIGGLVGFHRVGPLTNCYSTGAVIGTQDVGGLIGFSYATASNCFWDVDTSGMTTSARGTGKTTAEMKTLSTFTDASWDFVNTWKMLAGDYPRLTWEEVTVVIVPEVIGMLQSDAVTNLTASGLTSSIEQAYSETVPQGHIISQFPSPGTPVSSRSSVNIVVSLGKIFSGGNGTESDPFQISTAEDWQYLTDNQSFWDKYFILTNDIDFNGMELAPIGIYISDTDNLPFSGVLDGNNHALLNFSINQPENDYIALVGYLSDGAIRNFRVENAMVTGSGAVGGLVAMVSNNATLINCHISGNVMGYSHTGGLVGFLWNAAATVSNCSSSASVSGSGYVGGLVGGMRNSDGRFSVIIGSHATGAVNGGSTCGGLVGFVEYGTIDKCYAIGNVRGKNSIGGLVGTNGGAITGCYATGDITASDSHTAAGGLVGKHFDRASIINSFATGNISSTLYNSHAGGLVGSDDGGIMSNCFSTGRPQGYESGGLCSSGRSPYNPQVTNSFWDVNTSQISTSMAGIGKTTQEMQTLATYTAAGWDFTSIWWMPPGGGYPKLMWAAPVGSLQVFISPQSAIDAGAKWRLVGSSTWLNSGDTNNNVPVGTAIVEFKPAGDLIYPKTKVTVLEGQLASLHVTYKMPYSGGSGSQATPFQIDSVSDWLELTVTETDWDKHFVLTNDLDFAGVDLIPVADAWLDQEGFVTGNPFTGILDGQNHVLTNITISMPEEDCTGLFGWVENCQLRNLSIEQVTVAGNSIVAGLAAVNVSSTLANCHVSGIIISDSNGAGGLVGLNFESTITNCSATAVVDGLELVGGLVGKNDSGTITGSLSKGTVSGELVIGGLVGWNDAGTISACYSWSETSGTLQAIGGLVGYNEDGKLIRCYSTGRSTGPSQVGGLVGAKKTSTNYQDSANFWDIDTSGTTVSQCGTGKTTSEMQSIWMFKDVGWDFEDTWQMPMNDYPRLRWESLEPRCGDTNHPYPVGDLNEDCRVDLGDFVMMATNWLACSAPDCD